MSADPTSSAPTPTRERSPSAPELFAAGAAARLTATLYDAATRRAIVCLVGLALVTFAPLAMNSRNGWAFAGLMALVVGCIARWVAGWMFERERAQAQPMVMLILHAVIGLGWTAAAVATLLDPYGHGPALVLVATAIVAAACVPMLHHHRDACWALLAPMFATAFAVAWSPQPYAWPLAAAVLGGLGAAAWYAHLAQASALARIAAELRAEFVQAEWKKDQQAAAATFARLEARERELGLVWQHTEVGVARVEGFVIESVNDTLAATLGRPAGDWVRRDVLSLFAKEHHALLDVIVKRRAQNAAAPAHRERLAVASADGSGPWVDVVIGGGRSGTWLVFDTAATSATPSAAAAAAASAPAKVPGVTPPAAAGDARRSVLDRSAVLARLQAHADRRRRVTVMAVAVTGLEALTQGHGDGVAARVSETIAERLRAACRPVDDLAKLDEACWALVVVRDPNDADVSEAMAERVRTAMTTPHTLSGGSVRLGAEIETLPCDLDVQKATTALALLDDFVARAKVARAVQARPSTQPGHAGEGVTTTSAPTPLRPTQPPTQPQRGESAVVGRGAKAGLAVTQVEQAVVIDRIRIEPMPEDEESVGTLPM